MRICTKYHFFWKNIMISIKIITYLDVIWPIILVLNCSQAHLMALNKVRSSIEVPRLPHTGLGCTLTLPGYISQLMQFTWNRFNCNSIPISLTTIGYPLLFLVCLMLPANMKIKCFGCYFLLIVLFIIVRRIKNLWSEFDRE